MNKAKITIPEDIRSLGLRRTHARGELLFSPGEEARGLYFILSGEIRIYRMDEEGREAEVVRLFPGDFFGEAILFTSEVFPAYSEAVRNSEVLFFEKTRLLSSIDGNPAVARFFITLLAQKCVTLNRRIEMLGLQSVRQRLSHFLLSHCGREASCLVDLGTQKAELAKRLGTISETLSRNLKQMQDEGIIEVRGRRIWIPDCRRLKGELK